MNIIITGASNGIGYHTALLLSQNKGAKILVLSRNEKKLLQLTDESKTLNPSANINHLAFDLKNFNEEKLLEKLRQINFNSIDILIKNAGKLINKPFEK